MRYFVDPVLLKSGAPVETLTPTNQSKVIFDYEVEARRHIWSGKEVKSAKKAKI